MKIDLRHKLLNRQPHVQLRYDFRLPSVKNIRSASCSSIDRREWWALKYDAPFFNFTWIIVGAVRVAMSGSVGFAMVLF
jgi:hypothetical protein